MSQESERAESTELNLLDGLVQLSFTVQAVLTRAALDHDITVPQLRVMGILRDHEPGMLELAQHLGLDKSSVTGLIDRAERRGLVQRLPSARDGRAIKVRRTTLGRELTSTVERAVAIEINRLTSILAPAERQILAGLIDRVLVGRPPPAETPAPPRV